MRGWFAVPLIGSDGENYGFVQACDRLEGEFTEQGETYLVRLAALTSTALDALAQLPLPGYRAEGCGAACRVDIGRDQASQEEDDPMKHVGSVAMLWAEAHRVEGSPHRAGDRGACGGFDAKADRI
jgi:hypothetical protein